MVAIHGYREQFTRLATEWDEERQEHLCESERNNVQNFK